MIAERSLQVIIIIGNGAARCNSFATRTTPRIAGPSPASRRAVASRISQPLPQSFRMLVSPPAAAGLWRFKTLMNTRRSSFEYEDLLACGRGELFREGPQLPLPPMLMFDRISEIAEAGGEYGKGLVRAV